MQEFDCEKQKIPPPDAFLAKKSRVSLLQFTKETELPDYALSRRHPGRHG